MLTNISFFLYAFLQTSLICSSGSDVCGEVEASRRARCQPLKEELIEAKVEALVDQAAVDGQLLARQIAASSASSAVKQSSSARPGLGAKLERDDRS